MPLPSDLPETRADFDAERTAAQAKYRLLVRRLGSMEFVGLLDVVAEEVKRRDAENKRPGAHGPVEA